MEKRSFRFGWEVCQKAEEAEILLYSTIVSSKWDKEDDSRMTAAEFDKAMKKIKKAGCKRLVLRINSPGGVVNQAVAMKTMLETSGIPEIRVDIEGMCVSAATFFCCIQGAKVRIAEGSEFMIHNPSTGVWGTAEELEKTAKQLRSMEEEQHGWYAARTGKSEAEIKALMDATTWYTAKEAVKEGFCDELIQPTPAAKAAACLSEEAYGLLEEEYGALPEGMEKGILRGIPENHNSIHEEEANMDWTQVTAEQVKEAAPQLFEAILAKGREDGAKQERERVQTIDALTLAGYEDLAQEAKEKGTSAMEFQMALVKAQKAKQKEYLEHRSQETAAAAQVGGGSAGDMDQKSETEELKKHQEESARMAKELFGGLGGGMY